MHVMHANIIKCGDVSITSFLEGHLQNTSGLQRQPVVVVRPADYTLSLDRSPRRWAVGLGIDTTREGSGIGTHRAQMRYAQVTLCVPYSINIGRYKYLVQSSIMLHLHRPNT